MLVIRRGLVAATLASGLLMQACEYCLAPRSPEAERLLGDQTSLSRSPIEVRVLGMSCPKCVSNVDIQLMRVPGVKASKIDMATGIVQVELQPGATVTKAALAKAVDDSGLTVASIEGS